MNRNRFKFSELKMLENIEKLRYPKMSTDTFAFALDLLPLTADVSNVFPYLYRFRKHIYIYIYIYIYIRINFLLNEF
jgi:hypothetical protein